MPGNVTEVECNKLLEKLTYDSVQEAVKAILPSALIDAVLSDVGDTDSRGLQLTQLAFDAFQRHCRIDASTDYLVEFMKVDRGSNMSFSDLPAVTASKLGNVFKFNEHGHQENPDGVWNFTLRTASTVIKRGIVVEIDGDVGKAKQPRVTATKMWEHIMYSKLVSGDMKSNGFTMRVNMATANVDTENDDEWKQYMGMKRNSKKWMLNHRKFWLRQTVKELHQLAATMMLCMRDIVLSLLQQKNWLYDESHQNNYHVNIFVGPFDINIPSNNASTSQAIVSVPDNITTAASKKNFRKLQEYTQHLQWKIDFKMKCVDSGYAGVQVQYLLIENYCGLTSIPKPVGAMLVSATDKTHNRGLMSLLDIVHTPEIFLLNETSYTAGHVTEIVPVPEWKRKSYTKGSKNSQLRNDHYPVFFDVLQNTCNLMENFIMCQLKNSIVWKTETTWPLKSWMLSIAQEMNMSKFRLKTFTRADHTMTTSTHEQQSLGNRLRNSLCKTMPVIDPSVYTFMRKYGYDNIRDAEFYLRFIGVTNILALEQLSLTHATLLTTDNHHSRVFRSLPLGTQSEMRLMFARISVEKTESSNFLELICHPFGDMQTRTPPRALTGARRTVDDWISNSILEDANVRNDINSIVEWRNLNITVDRCIILNYIAKNADYFMTFGLYNFARSIPCSNTEPENVYHDLYQELIGHVQTADIARIGGVYSDGDTYIRIFEKGFTRLTIFIDLLCCTSDGYHEQKIAIISTKIRELQGIEEDPVAWGVLMIDLINLMTLFIIVHIFSFDSDVNYSQERDVQWTEKIKDVVASTTTKMANWQYSKSELERYHNKLLSDQSDDSCSKDVLDESIRAYDSANYIFRRSPGFVMCVQYKDFNDTGNFEFGVRGYEQFSTNNMDSTDDDTSDSDSDSE